MRNAGDATSDGGFTGRDSRLLRVLADRRGNQGVVTLSGEIDLSVTATLEERLDGLQADGVIEIIVDMKDVTFLDAGGLRAFVRAASNLERHGGRLTVRRVRPNIRRLFELTELLSLLEA
jgi:anti-anti-sigma factor